MSTPERAWPTTDAHDELTLLWQLLRFQRHTALGKATGTTLAEAIETPLATSPLMSILGVIKHLTAVERHWLTRVSGGADLPSLWTEDPDSDWRITPTDTPTTVLNAYRAEWALAETAMAPLHPDDQALGDPTRTIRWTLNHVIQETARHVGHLDILRELADGSTGE